MVPPLPVGVAGVKIRHDRNEFGTEYDDQREVEAELKRLHEERMKLDAMRAEFDDYARELRRAKDEAEFKGFMAERSKRAKDGDDAASDVSDLAKDITSKVSKAKKVKKSGGKTVPGV